MSPSEQAPPVFTTPSLLRRMACWLYEGMLLFGVVFIAGYLFSTLSQTHHALDNRSGLQAFLFLVLGIYFTWFWHRGQTLAMKTWHIRVVDIHGRPVSQNRALQRYLASWLWFAPPLVLTWPLHLPVLQVAVLMLGWVAAWAMSSSFQRERQFWHDVLVGTRLINTR